jgi:hypothetical protein
MIFLAQQSEGGLLAGRLGVGVEDVGVLGSGFEGVDGTVVGAGVLERGSEAFLDSGVGYFRSLLKEFAFVRVGEGEVAVRLHVGTRPLLQGLLERFALAGRLDFSRLVSLPTLLRRLAFPTLPPPQQQHPVVLPEE